MCFQTARWRVWEKGTAFGIVRDIETVVYQFEEGGEMEGGVKVDGREEQGACREV